MIATDEIPLVHHVDEKNDCNAGIKNKDKPIDVSACPTPALRFTHRLACSSNSLACTTNILRLSTKSPSTATVHCDVASNLTWHNGGPASAIDELRCTTVVGH